YGRRPRNASDGDGSGPGFETRARDHSFAIPGPPRLLRDGIRTAEAGCRSEYRRSRPQGEPGTRRVIHFDFRTSAGRRLPVFSSHTIPAMLTHLSVRNFAVVEAAEIEFGDGLTVVTGETGAGKSLLVDA